MTSPLFEQADKNRMNKKKIDERKPFTKTIDTDPAIILCPPFYIFRIVDNMKNK